MEPTVSSLWRLAGEALALCYRASPRYEARLTAQSALIVSGEPIADLNYAIIDQGSEAEAQLRDFVQAVETRQLALILFLTAAVADQLGPTARELGLRNAGLVPLMVYQPTAARSGARRFAVERVTDQAGLHASNATAADAFGLPLDTVNRVWGLSALDGPGVDVFLARQQGTPVSTVWTTRAGPVVGIWAMGTATEYQRKGAGRAVLEHAIQHHVERGVRSFYLLATAAGRPLYERVGFRTLTESAVWVAGASAVVGEH